MCMLRERIAKNKAGNEERKGRRSRNKKREECAGEKKMQMMCALRRKGR